MILHCFHCGLEDYLQGRKCASPGGSDEVQWPSVKLIIQLGGAEFCRLPVAASGRRMSAALVRVWWRVCGRGSSSW
jgi:hypothetical protein